MFLCVVLFWNRMDYKSLLYMSLLLGCGGQVPAVSVPIVSTPICGDSLSGYQSWGQALNMMVMEAEAQKLHVEKGCTLACGLSLEDRTRAGVKLLDLYESEARGFAEALGISNPVNSQIIELKTTTEEYVCAFVTVRME